MLISKYRKGNEIIDLSGLREKAGQKLPAELEKFLLKYNGGATPKTSFRMAGISSDIVSFYGTGDVKYSYQDVDVVEKGAYKYLPIAFDSFGNDILIELGSGGIFFQDHEKVDSISELAKGMESFVSNCKSERISPASLKSVEEREQDMIRRGRGSVITEELKQMWQNEVDKYGNMKQEEVIF